MTLFKNKALYASRLEHYLQQLMVSFQINVRFAKTSKVTKDRALIFPHEELSVTLHDSSLIKEDHFPSSVSGSQC